MIAYVTNEIPPNERITIVLITGDGDFADAVLSLRFLRHRVMFIAAIGSLSRHLRQSASEFLSWGDDVIGKVPKKALGRRAATNVHERPPFCGAISLGSFGPLSPPVYRQSLQLGEPEYYEVESSAQFLIPRSFEVLIRCLQGRPRLEPLSYLRQWLEVELGQPDDVMEEYLREAESLDIVQLHQARLPTGHRDFWEALEQPWWDGFD